jgi:hypothetical protein
MMRRGAGFHNDLRPRLFAQEPLEPGSRQAFATMYSARPVGQRYLKNGFCDADDRSIYAMDSSMPILQLAL